MGLCLGTMGAGAGASLLTTCACGAASCCVSMTCNLCGKSFTCQKSAATRGMYVFQFILISVIAYIFSYWAHDWFKDVPVLKQCDEMQCYGNLSVYRITFGLAVYHLFFAIFLIGAKTSNDWRAGLQDGWWPIKFLCLIGIIVGSFFIPNNFFVGYGWVMVIGAGIFIIVQLVLLIEFAYSWNEGWLRKMEDEEIEGSGSNTWYYLLLSVTFLMIAGAISLTGVMYKFFAPNGCGLNAFFITINLIVAIIYCVLCVVPKIREGRPSSGLLQSSVIFLYATYLVWSALMSEPNSMLGDEKQCNPFSYTNGSKAFSVVMGAAFTIISVVWATIRTAGSSENLLGTGESTSSSGGGDIDVEKPLINTVGDDDDDAMDDEKQGTTYNYTFFHLCFCLGAMYICMLLTNWMTFRSQEPTNSTSDDGAISVDSGMASTWIKIVSGWITIILYLWSLVAPVLLPDREWN
eukprot:TRINITY_DN2295_c0_g1_i1.p1 TRINITY_DN2295_c0_g1~~TRINITY_DN2295_c0_g1_i1.p1  ORF type:complete len:462 (-),score=119.91 TRINITY_DN2295_c0_g1_i1:3-1388(-)